MEFAFFKSSQKVFVSCHHPLCNSPHQIFNESTADELQAPPQLNSARLVGLPQMFLLLKVMETSWIISSSQ